MFYLSDELERAASAVAIAKAAPGAGLKIDHELPPVGPVMYWAAADELRSDALELCVETVVSENGC